MKTSYILFIFLFFHLSIFAQTLSLKDDNLKGKVKSVLLNHLKVIVEKDTIYGEKAPDNDSFWFNGYIDSYHIFNMIGNCIEFHTYFNDDADDNKTVNIYNEKGLLIEQNIFADNRYRGRIIYKYDKKGRVSLVIRYDETGAESDRIYHFRNNKSIEDNYNSIPKKEIHNNSWQYTYNDKDQCIEEICIAPNGLIAFRQIFFYDNNNNLSQSIFFDANNEQSISTKFKYNSSNKVIKIIKTGSNWHTVTKVIYDANGNEIYTSIKKTPIPLTDNDREAHFEECASRYIYDNNNNWVEKIFYTNKSPLFIQKREISYY